MPLGLNIDRNRLEEICRRYHVAKLELFGSRAKGTARPDSDADLLVTFEPRRTPSLFSSQGYMALMDDLERILGCRVDLITRASIENDANEYFRGSALSQTEVLYAA
jgi:predicted nucleotidyltransferase